MSVPKYSMRAICSNCKANWIVDIEKGVMVEQAQKDKHCEICGCHQIHIQPLKDPV